MKTNLKRVIVALALAAVAGAVWAKGKTESSSPSGEQSVLRISKQYGVNYLPLIVLEAHKLIEKNAQAAGLGEVRVEWVTFGGGSTANDAILAGTVDLISGGVAPFVRLWDKTDGKVKALASLDRSPLIFNTSNPNVKTLADFTEKDRIAIPSVKVSIQALVLQVEASKEFGADQFDKIDHLTVALSHPDALVALTSGKSEITAHLTNEPYATVERQSPGIHKVFDSFDVFGSPHTTNLVSTSETFYNNNPRLAAVIVQSLNEADAWIAAHQQEAAQVYLDITKSTSETVELVESIIGNGSIEYNTRPFNVTYFSDFLYDTKAIGKKPSERDLFFPAVFEAK